MKKTLILLGALTMGYTYAQEGKVGVNTDAPQATLDITPSNTNIAGTTNEGILAPRLSKERIANIATPVEGTLVYATDANYGGTNVAVSKITEKGYYFYNGTEWVKAGAGSALSSNIYTADGALTGDRKVTMGDKILTFEGNDGAKYLEVKNASWYPLVVNSTNSQGGGIAIHPNNLENRAEFSVNERGDIRFYQNGSGDVIFVEKNGSLGGFVGINNTNPKVRLDVIGGGRFKRIGSASTIEIDTDNGQWGHLDFRRNDVKRWDIGMTNGEETGGEAGSNFFISSFKDDGSFNASGLFINRKTGYTGIGTSNPESGLDVAGEIIARGQNQIDAYFGGDNVPAVPGRPMNDVEIGSVKAGITDVSLYNRADAKAMNLYANDLNAVGNIKSTALAGDGDKIVVANNDGTLTKGVSISNFATSNIYTADGSTNGDRTVSTANGFLTVKGNTWNPLVVNSEIVPGDPANNARGGIAVHPNDMEKRVEFATTKDGDSRIWLDGDRVFIKRATGAVGIGNVDPKAKLDVSGEILARGLDDNQVYIGGDSTPATLERTIADIEIGSLKAGVNDVSLYNRTDAKTMNLFANDLNAAGNVKSNTLSGDGDKIVMANNDGTLVKGVSISNFATSNIYTADGTLTGDRAVDQAGKWLDFNNGAVRITGNDGVYFPLSINTKHSGGNGGIAINPNGDGAKRVELNSTPEGNFRLWLDGDKIFVNRSAGHVGIGTNTPTQRLDVYGNGKFFHPNQSTIVHLDTSDDMWTHLDFRRNNVKRWDVGMTDTQNYFINSFKDNGDYHQTPFFIDRTTGNIAIHNVDPSEKLDVAGSIKSRDLAGVGNRNVVADANGKLVIGEATSNVRTEPGNTTLTAADNNGYVYLTGAGTVTVPSSLPQGFSCIVVQQGDGQVTIAGNGVTLQTARGTKTRTKFSAVGIIKRTTTEATITGDAVN